MPTPKNKYDREHLRRIEAIKRQIDAIYAEAVKEAAALGVTIDMPQDAEKPFSFDDYPMTEKRIEELMAWLRGQLETAVVNGIKAEWALSNDKNDAMVVRVFGSGFGDLPEDVRSRYLTTNDAAREAFIQRKRNGLGLSDYVWKYADGFKNEIEMGLDLGIRDGKDAPAMARDLKQYLRHPDMLFRRVRDEHGMLHLSRRAAAFHPGRGVYRSSYLNARRLAATETNIAYRTADHERWKKMDFVVGIEIHLSNNHTCKGRDGKPHPFDDICDELQGKYPKDFKFTGWHPHCRCFATSILKTDEEIAEDTKKILRGEEVTGESENRVEDVPDGFNEWVEKNQEKIEEGKSLPYFVRENGGYAGVKGESVALILATPASVGQQRSTDIHDLKDTSPPPRSTDIHDQMDISPPIQQINNQQGDFHVSKSYPNGGKVLVHNLVSSDDSDYTKLTEVADFFASMGKEVRLTPKMTRPPKFEYKKIYGSLIGTIYEGKCPDLNVDGLWYEHEGFITDNAKRAFSNMMNHGLKQSDRIIIDRPNLTDAYMKRVIFQRIKDGQMISEVWTKDGTNFTLLYKKSEE